MTKNWSRIWAVAGLEPIMPWAAKIMRWGWIAIMVITLTWVVGFWLMELNYAPLWFRLYNGCVDAQPDAVSVTEALRHRSECMRWASDVVKEQMKLKGGGR